MNINEAGCPACGGRGKKLLFSNMRDRLGLYPKAFDVYSCLECGTARTDMELSRDEFDSLYPDEYIIKDDAGRGRFKSSWTKLEMALFYDRKYAADVRELTRRTGLSGGRLLDVGCGNGRRAREFARAGFDVEGLDTSRVNVEYVTGELGLKARCGTIEELEFEKGSYDVITLYHVVEHLPEPKTTLEKLFGLLKPGGYIAALVPVADGIQPQLFGGRWIEFREMPRHVFIPSTQGMQRLVAGCGFENCGTTQACAMELALPVMAFLMPQAIGARAYKRNALAAVLVRLAGAATVILAYPFALVERMAGKASVKTFWARKPGA